MSTTPKNRFASEWKNAKGGLAEALGGRIHAKTGKPVGIVYMNGANLELKHWIGFDHLAQAPSLVPDYENLAAVEPGNRFYAANARRYIAAWKKYWGDYVPQLIATQRVPDGVPWGTYPTLGGSVTTTAAQAYNMMVYPFSSCRVRGIVFLCSETMVKSDEGANYGPELSALANSWKATFGGEDPRFFYTIPNKTLAPKITRPTNIEGKGTAIELREWRDSAATADWLDDIARSVAR